MAFVPVALRVELTTQLGEEQREVLLVLRTLDIPLQSALDRKFPVDVDAVEETRPSPNEQVDRRSGEFATRSIV